MDPLPATSAAEARPELNASVAKALDDVEARTRLVEARPEPNAEVAKALDDVRASRRHVDALERHVLGTDDRLCEKASQFLPDARERLRKAEELLREAMGEPAAGASAGPATESADATDDVEVGTGSGARRDQGGVQKVNTDMHLALERSSANSDAGIAGGAPDVDTSAESPLLGGPPVASISAGGLRKRVGGWGLLRL